mmetsp:Transcript_16630/g.42721  ORF Transcript_16630/g.42721 Transcript_16630/m.42721 type:complete len:116 (+) Transcript_16630:1093-1440(+)
MVGRALAEPWASAVREEGKMAVETARVEAMDVTMMEMAQLEEEARMVRVLVVVGAAVAARVAARITQAAELGEWLVVAIEVETQVVGLMVIVDAQEAAEKLDLEVQAAVVNVAGQ